MKKIRSYAKVNASINILGKDKNKLHKIETFFFFINLFDEIYISEKKTLDHRVVFSGRFSKGIEKNNSVVNLLQILEKEGLLKKKFNIKIIKKIPTKSGLGGGSMNAASLINYFVKNKIIKISKLKIIKICDKIGSDVVLGLNDKLLKKKKNTYFRMLKTNFKLNCVLIKPNFGCSTKSIYKKVNFFNKPYMNRNKFRIFTLKKIKLLNNDLQKIVFKKHPKLHKIQQNLEKCEKIFLSRMTGSGSCIVGYSDSKKGCLNALKLMKKKYKNYWCIQAKAI